MLRETLAEAAPPGSRRQRARDLAAQRARQRAQPVGPARGSGGGLPRELRRRARSLWRAQHGHGGPRAPTSASRSASRGDYAGSESLLRELLAIALELDGPTSDMVLSLNSALAATLHEGGEDAEALRVLDANLPLIETDVGAKHPQYADRPLQPGRDTQRHGPPRGGAGRRPRTATASWSRSPGRTIPSPSRPRTRSAVADRAGPPAGSRADAPAHARTQVRDDGRRQSHTR